MAFGLDYVSGPSPSVLKTVRVDGQPVTFVCRYLSEDNPLTEGKIIRHAEAQALIAAGIAIVSNYEWYATRPLEGEASGIADAHIAASQHAAAGGPSTRPIYFSVDLDVAGEQVAHYFEGIANTIDLARTGAYGSARVLAYLFDHHLISWGWQTYAWSYGVWEPRAHIQQFHNDMTLGGHSVDFDRSTTADFGQWGLEDFMAIDIHTPGIAAEFDELDASHWRSKRTGKIIAHGLLAAYKTYGNAGKCGLDYLGHPESNEQVIGPNKVKQFFDKAVLCWDNGTVFPLNLYDNGPGTDTRIPEYRAQIAQLQAQLLAEQQKVAPVDPILQAKIDQLKALIATM